MNLEQIKQSVAAGRAVYWANENYRVIKDSIGQYLIWSQSSNAYWGLTHLDGVTLNGAETEFFTKDDMKTIEEIREYARGLAWGHFYSDEDTPWQPFEDWPEHLIEEEIDNLTAAVTNAMVWAQGGVK